MNTVYKNRLYVIIGIVVMTVLPTLIWTMFIRTETKPLTVNKFTWERNIPIEKYKTVQEEDWTVPSNGRILYSFSKIHHYRSESYPCTRTDSKGKSRWTTCSRSVPVYWIAYRYDIDRWKYDHSLTTKASEHSKPFWPVVDPTKYNLKKEVALGDLRTGNNWIEKYVVILTDGKHEYKKPVTFVVWESLKYGDHVTGSFNMMGSLRGVAWRD